MSAPIDLNPKSVLLSSGIGALGSLGSAVLGGILNRSNMAAQVEKSKELMQYQWDHFQSPKAQVNALAAAGLNPAVALGQGGSGFTATPSAAMPTSQPVPVPDIGTIGQFVQAMAMAKKLVLIRLPSNFRISMTKRLWMLGLSKLVCLIIIPENRLII